MILGLLGRKLGMAQRFNEDGTVSAVTAVEVGPCTVIRVRTPERDGYEAVQLGFGHAKRLTKPVRGQLQGLGEFRYLREVRARDAAAHTPGEVVRGDIFQPGERIAVMGTSKGKGFAGGVKRYHFHGGPKTHGQKDRHRAPGSIGAGTTPGRIVKGHHMAGHMGDRRVTVLNVRVVAVDAERNLLFIAGAVPGATDGLLMLRKLPEGG
jgi:large subunit ribosomal protein L3